MLKSARDIPVERLISEVGTVGKIVEEYKKKNILFFSQVYVG